MLRLQNLAKFSSARGTRSIWLAGTSRSSFLARTSRTMFTTSRRSSVKTNQHHEKQENLGGVESPRFEPSPDGPTLTYYPIILTLGLCLTAYGVYHIYGIMTMWPKVLRDDLRRGLKHRNQGNFPLSIRYLQQAWETAKSLPLDLFKPDPLLKTSGIAIVLAGVLEGHGKKEEAYKVYKEALWQLQSTYLDLPPNAPQPELGTETLKLLTDPEKMRAAALGYKLGCLASELGKPEKEEEKWLTWSVNAILVAVIQAPAGSGMDKVARIPSAPPGAGKMFVVAQDMRLPPWARNHDIAAPFEALGTFYSEHGKRSYALPLYLQAISILLPPLPLMTSAVDRCRAAQLMAKVSETILASGTRVEAIDQATSWAQKGLDVVIATRQSNKANAECELAYISMLFNVALMRRLSGEDAKSRELYETALKQCNARGLEEIAGFARREIQALDPTVPSKSMDKTL